MSNTEIKKALLKNKPTAYFTNIRKGHAYYMIDCLVVNDRMLNIVFEIPLDDMGDADFYSNMEGNLLLRWIYASTDKGSFSEFIKEQQNKIDNL